MRELCERFGIAPKTGYKWLARYAQEGVAGLRDRPRAPHTCPHRTPPELEARLLEFKRQHPTWGSHKIRRKLQGQDPTLPWPAASTIDGLFQRHGLTEPRHPRPRQQRGGAPPLATKAPNEVWTADFKGEFRLRNGRMCYPLTVQDAHSRFLLTCVGLPDRRTEGVLPIFTGLFQRYGLPNALRTDNGAPFGSPGLGGHSRLSIFCLQLGIQPQRITPGRPTENARHERMHRTLKAETTRPPAEDFPQQQETFDYFRREFNEQRPHAALNLETPASVYEVAARTYPAEIPPPVYPAYYEVRRVNNGGRFYFRGQSLFLTEVLIDHQIGLTEVEDGIWSIYFYDHLMGRLNEETGQIA
jgi:transposase InsO family protein